jgi:hypothetical protein
MPFIDVAEVAPKKGDPPFVPYIHIILSDFTHDSDGFPLLSPQLMSDKEIDDSIDSLVMQLEKARKTAKSKLKKAKELRK